MKKHLLISVLLLIALMAPAQINDAATLIDAMHKKYHKKWYANLTFTQNTTFYQDNEVAKEETWYEALKMPQGLIIKIGSPDADNGIIFKRDSMYVFQGGSLARKMRRQHELLILGFSVYFDRPEMSLNKLEEAGFDLSHFNADDQHFIIGNPETKQAWIEKKRLIFIKMESNEPNGNKTQTRFNKYQKAGKGWIAPEVLFYSNGNLVMKEEYYDISYPEALDNKLFDVNTFADTKLIYD